MHICFVSCAFAPLHGGGVAVSLALLAEEFISKGHQVSVFTLDNNQHKKTSTVSFRKLNNVGCYVFNADGVNVDFFDRYRQRDYYNRKVEKAFSVVVEEANFDVIHFHAIQGLGANLINVPHKFNIRSVVSFHDFWWVCPNLFYTDLEYADCQLDCSVCHKQLSSLSDSYKTKIQFYDNRREYLKAQLDKVDVVLSNSKFLKNEMSNWAIDKVSLNENGIDLPKNELNKVKVIGRAIIGFVGGDSELKGYSIVRSAFELVKDPNVELHIYGLPFIGKKNWLKDIRKGIAVNKIQDIPKKVIKRVFSSRTESVGDSRVKLFGTFSKDEKYDVFNTFDAVIVGTRVKESFSLVTREAQILNIPVITGDCGGPLDIIEDGVNGYVYDRNSSTSLSDAIHRYLVDAKKSVEYDFKIGEIQSITGQSEELLKHYTA